MRRGDGVGSYLIKRLQKKTEISSLDAGDVPENYIGEIALIELGEMKKIDAFTHSANLSLLLRVIP